MCCTRRLVAVLMVSLAWAGSSHLGAVTAAEYVKQRQALAPRPITAKTELMAAQVSAPTLPLEVRGMVCGLMTDKDRQLVQVQLADRTAFDFYCPRLEPELNLGSQVRVLVAPDKEHPSTYRLVAVAWEEVLAPLDPKPKPTPEPAGSYQPSPYQPYPSRGGDVQADRAVIMAYKDAVKTFNRRLSDAQATKIAVNIIENSIAWGVDARLIMAVIACESRFRPDATSPKGAMGLGQLMPATARGLGVRNAYNPEENIAGAIRLISGHLERTGDLALALACYNAGPGAVRKYGGVPPYRETVNYIRKVTEMYFRLAPEMRPG